MAFLSCDEFRALLADEVSGADGPEREMRSHLAACAPCAAHAGEILWQDRVLAELSARALLEPLMARVRESILNTRPVEFAGPPLRVRVSSPRWGRAAVAAAVLLAALAALLVFRPSGGGQVVVHPPEIVVPSRNDLSQNPPMPNEAPLPPGPSVRDIRTPAPAPQPEPVKQIVAQKPENPKKDAPKPSPQPEPPTGPEKPHVAQTPVVGPVAKDINLARTRTVDQAVSDGMGFLQRKTAAIEGLRINRDRYDELVLWTYVHGGMAEADSEFQKVLRRMLERKLERTYAVALQAMTLEELDRVAYQGRIQQCAQFLLDNQCKNGQWAYGDPSIFAEEVPAPAAGVASKGGGSKKAVPAKDLGPDLKPKVARRVILKKMRQGPESGDHSNSMYAALGLRACHDAGMVIPQDVVLLAQKAWREAQIKPEGGWCYGRHEGHKAYGSMTAGGVGSLVIYDYISGQDKKQIERDPQVKAGLDWLEKKFSVSFNPGPYEHSAREDGTQHYFYYMYALERAAILYGTTTIGRNDWYQKGSEALLGCQRQDGSWLSREGGNEVSDTCFAILFLKRATRGLPEVSTGVRPK